MTAPTDTELMERLTRRDQGALQELYTRYANLVYSLSLRILQSKTLAEEVTQDTFLDVWNRPERWLPEKGRLSSWLMTLARYTAIDRLRHERHHLETVEIPYEQALSADTADNSSWLGEPQVRPLLAGLPPEQRQLIELAFFQGFTHSEIAKLLGMPLGTVKTRLRTGLIRLRALWEECEE